MANLHQQHVSLPHSPLQGDEESRPAPELAKPIPIQVLHHAQAIVGLQHIHAKKATMDMGWVAFFYLICPREYYKAPDNKPSSLRMCIC